MKASYDFSKGKRGRILPHTPEPAGKVRLTIRLDADIVEHFGSLADATGGKVGYQTLINDALRSTIDAPKLIEAVRSAVHEEFEKRDALEHRH